MVALFGFSREMAAASTVSWRRKEWPGPGQAVGNSGARRLRRLRTSLSALTRGVPIRSRF